MLRRLEEIGILDFDSASAEAVMAKYDADRSGTLELAEFRLLVKELRLVASEKKVFEQDIARLKTRLRNQSRGLLDPRRQFCSVLGYGDCRRTHVYDVCHPV